MDFLSLFIGIALGALLGWLVTRSTSAGARATAAQLSEQLEAERLARSELIEQHRIEREQRDARERDEARVLEKLAPVSTIITDLKAKVEAMERARTDQHAELRTQLRTSLELSSELTRTTQSLSRVMSDNSLRGTWGELQLARIAELSGLRNGIDYELQETLAGEDGRGRPDMIVKLPGGTFIAVDAKAPFAAYSEAMALTDEATSSLESRKRLFEKHAKDLRGHINTLASRDYANNLPGKVDYVVCFVPADSILVAALDADHGLLEYALSKKVVLASPSSLVAVLRPVSITWAQVENAENAMKIVEMGRTLYSRLSTMASHAAKVGSAIQSSAKHFNAFAGSLERSVLPAARAFDSIDSKDLPEVETIEGTINLFTTPELRGLNAELESGQPPIGEPVDAEEV
ncbi:MAG TPA: DNA recombination protein RmuC [Microbacteriaceae bacterium]|nr:DNA recombination protein RmuC [Microbacteriaceae bacterium]